MKHENCFVFIISLILFSKQLMSNNNFWFNHVGPKEKCYTTKWKYCPMYNLYNINFKCLQKTTFFLVLESSMNNFEL